MKNKAHDLATYAFRKEEPLLLDTNVWLYLFPAPSDKAHYGQFGWKEGGSNKTLSDQVNRQEKKSC